MHLLLNIGLDCNDGSSITAEHALTAINAAGGYIYSLAVHESDTEQTLVASVFFSSHHRAVVVHAIAAACRQDCVAAWDPALGFGLLAGPKPWGEFDGAFFLTLDGARLVSEEVVA